MGLLLGLAEFLRYLGAPIMFGLFFHRQIIARYSVFVFFLGESLIFIAFAPISWFSQVHILFLMAASFSIIAFVASVIGSFLGPIRKFQETMVRFNLVQQIGLLFVSYLLVDLPPRLASFLYIVGAPPIQSEITAVLVPVIVSPVGFLLAALLLFFVYRQAVSRSPSVITYFWYDYLWFLVLCGLTFLVYISFLG